MARRLFVVSTVSCVLWALTVGAAAQSQTQAQASSPDRAATEAMARRVSDRVRALQQEADRLATEARTLVGDLRRLEVERNIAVERLKEAEAGVATAQAELDGVSTRVNALEHKRVASLPDLSARFVELYKRGRGSYARMLAGVRDLRELGRATRAVSSLVHINRRRVEEHRRTVESLRAQHTALQEKSRALQVQRANAQKARTAADRALNARSALLSQIDSRRDLNAQLAGELLMAQQKLQAALGAMRAGQDVQPVSVPLPPFRSALDWPVVGPVTGRYGQAGRGPVDGVRNGIEVAAPEGTPVRVVHPGTVSFADSFTGYGTLVIVDHGSEHYSLYGYLSSIAVQRGEHAQAGQELGRIGLAPAGPAALYFELRIDGRSVDPLQWLKRR